MTTIYVHHHLRSHLKLCGENAPLVAALLALPRGDRRYNWVKFSLRPKLGPGRASRTRWTAPRCRRVPGVTGVSLTPRRGDRPNRTEMTVESLSRVPR